MSDIEFAAELGLLGLLGYRVGNRGLLLSDRRKILDRAWAMPIFPDVKRRVANWQEWGEPKSAARRQKLLTTLGTFASRPGMTEATSDWQRDLDYVRRTLCIDGVDA